MRMKRRNGCAALPPLLLLLLLLLALLLALCGCSGSRADYVGRQVGLDLPRTESVTYQDSHCLLYTSPSPRDRG